MRDNEFDPECRDCPRLAGFLDKVRLQYPDYHAAPVPPFGSRRPRLIVVGLAPGMHGANATGRPFTGDYAGTLLYRMLYEYGYSNQPVAESLNDGLKLWNCRVTNAVKCLPPQNKPSGAEIRACNRYLREELVGLKGPAVILALGRIAHDAVLRALDRKLGDYPFGHGACYRLDRKRYLLASYHCSRYNTQTRRLTVEMFREIFDKIHELLNITI